jgi:uncharacterized protein YoxC
VQTVDLNPVASAFLVAGYLVTSLLMAGAFLVIALGLGRLNAKLDDLIAKLDPVLSKTDQILSTTNDKLASIGDKAEEILVQGEGVAETVHSKVDKTATAVQRTIHAPIIGLNSFAAGVSGASKRSAAFKRRAARRREVRRRRMRIPATRGRRG